MPVDAERQKSGFEYSPDSEGHQSLRTTGLVELNYKKYSLLL